MNKEEFLEKLRKKLDILNQDEVNDIIDEYGGYIDEKVKKGKTEEEAIKEFGDFDELVKEILSAYKINEDYEEKKKDWFSNFFEAFGSAIDRIVKNLSKKSGSEIAKFVIEIIILLLIISLFRLPVELIENLGEDIFSLFISPFDHIFIAIWRFVVEICYIALALIFFVKIVKERYLDDAEPVIIEEKPKKVTKRKNNETKKREVVEEKKNKEEPQKSSPSVISGIANVCMWFIKAMLIVLMFPLSFVVIGLMIACFIGITLLCSGIPYFGVVLCIFAVLSFFLLLLEALFNFIASKKNHPTKMFISLLVTFVLLSVGITMTAVEVADSKFVDKLPERYEVETITKEVTLDDIKNARYRNYYWNISLEEDDTKKDSIEVSFTYSPEYISYRDFPFDFFPEIKRGKTYRIRDILDIVKEDLKDRTVYNYSLLFAPQIKITASKEMITEIKNSIWNRYYDDEEDRLYHTIRGLEKDLEQAEEDIEYWKEKYNILSEENV